MWSDNETNVDFLGFRVHADLIRALVLRPDLLPITIGLFGDWGSGKSSIMQMLQHSLDPANTDDDTEKKRLEHVAVLYFNGWVFEGYDDAKAALLSTILKELATHQRFGPRVKHKIGTLLETVDMMRLAKVTVKDVIVPITAAVLTHGATAPAWAAGLIKRLAPEILGDKPDVTEAETEDEEEKEDGKSGSEKTAKSDKDDWSKLIKKSETVAPPNVRSFREDFASLLNESNIQALVVLIDDLDRCSPTRILDNLEAIKLFLNVEHTAFVIGADPRIVRHAILTRYPPHEFQTEEGGTQIAEAIATDYLEKLIQVPYRLPRLSPAEVETYMALLFCLRDITDTEEYSKVLLACDQQRAENRYSSFGYAAIEKALNQQLPTSLAESLAFCAKVATLITEGLKGNPRQVKRFLNAFMLRKELARVAKLANIRDDVLVKLMLLEYGQHFKQFLQLSQWQESQAGFPEEMRKFEGAISDGVIKEDAAKAVSQDLSDSFMRRWGAMEPHLSDIDLRDYFWVARDKLETSLTAVSLLPPHLRRILEDLLGSDGARHRGASSAASLPTDEVTLLLANLEQHLLRRQEDTNGYNAFLSLIQLQVAGVASSFATCLLKCVPQNVPANVPLDLNTSFSNSDENRVTFAPILEHWANISSAAVGRAAKKVLAGAKKGQ